ncbi:MAG: hypothetical protein ETSY1_17130 [Candidatus Entotheonella factor]|uniref:OmpR/PhoB-type domain-containing protein n=1 Tax=Entotheonella factor TaxID=1429438 RepID=W4LLL3_ENTF1|nr:MAG: hypothetical protein ETSY1_17130 [Candidatus Entotheonella factor]
MIYTFLDYVLDTNRKALYRAHTAIKLEPKVYQVLVYLVEHHQRLVTKDELLEQFWAETYVNDNAVARCIRALRRALDDSRHTQRIILTQHRQGYRFVAPVDARDDAPVDDTEPARPEASEPVPASPPHQPPHPRARFSGLARNRSSVYHPPPPVSPFVGRNMHLSWCDYALNEVLRGHPNVMILQGEAGMGKTRLLHEVQDRAGRRGLQIYVGRCSETHSLPYMPFISALREPWIELATQLDPDLGADAAILRQWLQLDIHPAVSASALGVEEGEHAKLRLFLAVAR